MKHVLRKAFTMLELIIVIVTVGILALAALPRIQEDRLYETVDQMVTLIRHTQHLAMQDNPYDPNDPEWFKKRWSIQIATCPEGLNKFGYKGQPFGITVFKETNPSGPSRPVFAKDPSNPNGYLYSGYVSEYSSSVQPCDLTKYNKALDFRLKGIVSIYGGFNGKGVDNLLTTGMVNETVRGNVSPNPQNCPNASFSSMTLSFDEFGRPHFPSRLGRPYGGDIWHCGGANMKSGSAGYIYKRFKFTIAGRKQVAHIYVEGETGFVHVKYKDNIAGNFSPNGWDAQGY